jgi:tetratricopeptide (TPR) repeat protein
MTDAFERYKDALRRGHSAAQRGRFDEAITAYQEAGTIAPDRAMPQSSLGGVLARMGRTTQALAAYDAALSRAPEDEPALRGRAELLAMAGRRAEAADTLDGLMAALDKAGRLGDAADAGRLALELAESRSRRRAVEVLAGRLREAGDTATADALAAALGIEAGSDSPAAPPEPKRDPRRAVLSAAAVLSATADTALDSGDRDEARRCYLEAAAAQRSIGNLHAALDACYQAMAVSPAAGDVHLALTELYLDRGWRSAAADKLVLLGRLTDLAQDDLTRARLCTMAAERFPEDARLTAFCA